jgi:hypothetical protein
METVKAEVAGSAAPRYQAIRTSSTTRKRTAGTSPLQQIGEMVAPVRCKIIDKRDQGKTKLRSRWR